VKNLQILYEDNSIIIVNKPAGLAVQGGKGVKSSLDKILMEIRFPPPLLVHRLDKDTSGLLLAAKEREAAARFSRIITEKKTIKQYTAICSGCPEKKEGIITQELSVNGKMKKSETRYRVIKNSQLNLNDDLPLDFSVLEIELGTGRMHQIRRHLAMIGNPVLGDDKYGDFSLNKKLRKTAGLKRLLLHASRLTVKNEINLDVIAPLPEYFSPFT
jgi:23S rRNA pseudouridine955/2504/2580 synthase